MLVPRDEKEARQVKTFGYIQYWMVLPLLLFFIAIGYGTLDDLISWLFLVSGMAALWALYLYGAIAYFWTRQWQDARKALKAQQATLEEETDEADGETDDDSE